MFTVVLVDDEPSATKYLNSIIINKCNGFKVIATAESGEECLKHIRLLKPDLVIADVKMPSMNGIELAYCIKNEFDFIYTIIVSSYTDFEYTKGAIQSDVVDYFLKPVNPFKFKALLDAINKKLRRDFYNKRIRLLKTLITGGRIEEWQIDKYLPHQYYNAAILRHNGLPLRFASKEFISVETDLMDTYPLNVEFPHNENIWIVTGRDEKEKIFICSDEEIPKLEFEAHVKESKAFRHPSTPGYTTLCLASKPFMLCESQKTISKLYHLLDNSVTIGVSRIVYTDFDLQQINNDHKLDKGFYDVISYLVTNGEFSKVKDEIKELFDRWKEQKSTQLHIDNELRQILLHIRKFGLNNSNEKAYDIEASLEQVLCNSLSISELFDRFWSILESIICHSDLKNTKLDSPLFLKSVKDFLNNNIAEQHSLQSICKNFYVSQTYLNKLFRKYEHVSFNEYLTALRIGKAKSIMMKNPGIPIKDVASFVGYSDPFYFSKVFKSVVGVPPSEYRYGDNSV